MTKLVQNKGFTTLELMMVVLIIGILVSIVVPSYIASRTRTEGSVCFRNQRTLEGAAQQWSVVHDMDMSALQGVVSGTSPLIGDYILRTPPRCPGFPRPADPMDVDLAHGAYELDDQGNCFPCTLHGSYR